MARVLIVNGIPITPISFEQLEAPLEQVRKFRVDYPDGEIMEFEARLSDVLWQDAPEGGSLLTLPFTVSGTVRTGSIYDREGAD